MDDLADDAAKALDIGLLPLPEMRGLFIGKALFFVFSRIVDLMPQFVVKKRRELAAPHFAAIGCELNRTTQICQHES